MTSTGPRPTPWAAALRPAVHGAFHARAPEHGAVLDFSANGNVIGPSDHVREALLTVDLSRYPDPESAALRAAIARREGVGIDSVAVGNGSTELIWALARAYLTPEDVALVCGPTYGEYAVASQAVGAEVVAVGLSGGQGLLRPAAGIGPSGGINVGESTDLRDHDGAPLIELGASVAELIRRTQPRVVWLCHPNNPTGLPVDLSHVPALLSLAPETLFVFDEAYLSLSPGVRSAKSLIATHQVAVLRSMTKDAALAGVRIGALLAAPEIVDVVRRMTPPWSVSSLAQAAGIAACEDVDHLERVSMEVERSRIHLTAGLRALGLGPWPSVANFVTVPVGDGRAVAMALLDLGFAVRDCASFGLPTCIRIGVRLVEDQERLLEALRVVLTRERSPAHDIASALPAKIDSEPEPRPAARQPDEAGAEPRPSRP